MLRGARGGPPTRRGSASQAFVLRARRSRDRQVEPVAACGACRTRGRHAGRGRGSASHCRARRERQRGHLAAPHRGARRGGAQARRRRRCLVERGRGRRREPAGRVFLGNRSHQHDRTDRRARRRGRRRARAAVCDGFSRRDRGVLRAPWPRVRFRALGFRTCGLHVAARTCGGEPGLTVCQSRDHRTGGFRRRAGIPARGRLRRRAGACAGVDGSHLRVDRRASVFDAARRARRRTQRRPPRGRRTRRARATIGARGGRERPVARPRAGYLKRAFAGRAACDEAPAEARRRRQRLAAPRRGGLGAVMAVGHGARGRRAQAADPQSHHQGACGRALAEDEA